MIYHFQSGGNPEAENDAKETPLEVADEPETRRLLLEGIFLIIIYLMTNPKNNFPKFWKQYSVVF